MRSHSLNFWTTANEISRQAVVANVLPPVACSSQNNRKHFNVPRADRHCTHCDQSLMGDEIHFLYECPKVNNLRVKYMYSPDIRREPNVFKFVNIMQTNELITL